MDNNANRFAVFAFLALVSFNAAAQGFYIGVNAGGSDYDVEASDLAVPVALLPPVTPVFNFFVPGALNPSLPPAGQFAGGISSVIPCGVLICPPPPSSFVATPTTEHLDTSGTALRVEAGYRFNDYFAAELAYIDLGKATYEATYTFPAPFSGQVRQRSEVEIDGIGVSLLGSYPFHPRWSVFARGGYFFADAKWSSNIGTSSVNRPTYSADNAFVSGGVDFSFTTNWGVRLEYQRYLETGGGALREQADVDSWILGVQYRL